jgi:hypothetical protein
MGDPVAAVDRLADRVARAVVDVDPGAVRRPVAHVDGAPHVLRAGLVARVVRLEPVGAGEPDEDDFTAADDEPADEA